MAWRADLKQAVEEFLEAFKPPYSRLADLSAEQREALFGLIMERLDMTFSKRDLDYMVDKEDLSLADLERAFLAAAAGRSPAFADAEDLEDAGPPPLS